MPWPTHSASSAARAGQAQGLGKELKLNSLLHDRNAFQKAPSPVYGENKATIQYRLRDLLWRPAGRMVRLVAVLHPSRGSCLLMSTDISLAAIEIIRLRSPLQDHMWPLTICGVYAT